MVGPVVVGAGGGVHPLSLSDMLCFSVRFACRANSAIPPLRLTTTVSECNSLSAMKLHCYHSVYF